MTKLLCLLVTALLAAVIPSAAQVTPVDILFLIDASASIDQERFYSQILSYTEGVVRSVAPGSQVGLLTFNREVNETIPFKEYTQAEWDEYLDRIRERDVFEFRCCSPFAEALEKANEIMKSRSKNDEKLVLLFTDGMPYQNPKDSDFPDRKYAYQGTKSDEQEYLHTVVPEVAKGLKEGGSRLVVFAHPGINVKTGEKVDPNTEYFSGSETILGAEGNEKVCVNLQRFKPQQFCRRSDNFPIVSEPVNENLVSISDWAQFHNASTKLGCVTLGGIACITETNSPTTASPTAVLTTLSPTSGPTVTTTSPTAGGTTAPSTAPSVASISCSDSNQNGEETGVDCGGPICPKCNAGATCRSSTDCMGSLFCKLEGTDSTGGICEASSCTDEVQNGNETDKDCGGSECAPCLAGNQCISDLDCSDSLVCSFSGVCEGPGWDLVSAAGWIALVATIVVLSGYALVGVATGAVTAGKYAGYFSKSDAKSCCEEVCSVVTLFEFISFAQFCAVGSLMTLPGVPANFYAFARFMGFTLFNFIPVGPSPGTILNGGRRLADEAPGNVDILAVYAVTWNLQPEYLAASVFTGIFVTFIVIVVLYVVSIKVQSYVARSLYGDNARKVKRLTTSTFISAAGEAVVCLMYYGAFPIILVATYQFQQSSNLTPDNPNAAVIGGFTVLAGIVVTLFIICTIFGIFRSWKFPDLDKLASSIEGNTTNAGNANTQSLRGIAEKMLGSKKMYRRLVADWKHECRLFWIDRLLISVIRGIILGVVGTQYQAVGVLILVLLYCLIEFCFQPYKTRVQNLAGLFIGLCYVPCAILLVVFGADPVPFTQTEGTDLGIFAIVIHLLVLLVMMILVLFNYYTSWKRGLKRLKTQSKRTQVAKADKELGKKDIVEDSKDNSNPESGEFFDVELEDVDLHEPVMSSKEEATPAEEKALAMT